MSRHAAVTILLSARVGTSPNDVRQAVHSVFRHVARRTSTGVQVAALVRYVPDPVLGLPHGAVMRDTAPCDAFVELRSDGSVPGLLPVLTGLGAALPDSLDLTASSIVAGTEHRLVAARAATTLLMALQRLPGLDHEAFADYWLHRHGRLAQDNPDNEGYAQLHADSAWTRQACAEAELPLTHLDGLARACFRDAAAFLDRMSSAAVADVALADEARFIDHGRSAVGLYEPV